MITMKLKSLLIALCVMATATDAVALADFGRMIAAARAARNADRAADAARATRNAERASDAARASQARNITNARRVQAQVREQELRRQAANADAASLVRGAVQVRTVYVQLNRVAEFASALGLSPSGSDATDRAALIDMGANAAHGNLDYYPLLCGVPFERPYHLPSSSDRCLDGRLPTTTREPMDLSPLVAAEH